MIYGVQLGCLIFNLITWYSTLFDITHVGWHTLYKVCDDNFDQIDAESACYTLGYTNGGTFQTASMSWSESEIPFLMNEVECESASTNFLSCSSIAEDCTHSENILLTCFASGKRSSTFCRVSSIIELLFGFYFNVTFYRISFTEQLKIVF